MSRVGLLFTCLCLIFLSACGKEEPTPPSDKPEPEPAARYDAVLKESSPTFTRPDPTGELSESERTNPYHRHLLRVETSGWYAITSEQTFDGYLLIYEGVFNPTKPSEPITRNDDFPVAFNPAATPPGSSRLRVELKAGEAYSVITTLYCNGDEACGPRTGSFVNTVSPTEAPPPPFELPEPEPDRFNITVRFLSDNLSDAQKVAFTEAAERWSEVITGDLSDFVLDGPREFAVGAPEVVGTIDDLLIDTNFVEVDGPNGVLGSAGPRIVREKGSANELLTVYGVMTFDIAEFEEGGFFEDPESYRDVILHEMGHVLGIGTLWDLKKLTEGVLPNPPTVTPSLPNPDYDPRFTGEKAVTAYGTLLQAADKPVEPGVPIANTGGPGNYNGHWRELTFDNELMTPYASGLELLSGLTAASLADLGYSVDLNSAEIDASYALPLPAELEQLSPTPVTYTEFNEFLKFGGSQGSTSATVENVDLYLVTNADPNDPNSRHPVNSTSGCETDDFAGFTAGNIALMQRGGCLFDVKIQNAVAARASGIILFNQGDENTAARQGLFRPGAESPVPAVAVSFFLGVDLADIAQETTLRMRISTPTQMNARLRSQAAPKRVLPFNEQLHKPTHTLSATGKIVPLEEAPTEAPVAPPSSSLTYGQ